MTPGATRNMAASVLERLRNLSRESGEDHQFLLQRYVAERFLYRLGESPHRENFVLKGATLLALWGGETYRPTRDLDFTAYGNSYQEHLRGLLREICSMAVEDGVIFDSGEIRLDSIRGQAAYNSFRTKLRATIGTARISLQIDIGFGNAIQPSPVDSEYSTLLDHPPPRIRIYPREAFVAEKLHAMVVLGGKNSRYKDFYDLYTLSEHFAFDGKPLLEAVRATFRLRETSFSDELPIALTPQFYADARRTQEWMRYLNRDELKGAPQRFGIVGERMLEFLGEIWRAVPRETQFIARWPMGGPWRHKPYPAYQASGIEWLGEIPEHWEVKRLKYVATLNDEVLPETTSPTFEINYVDISSVDEFEGIFARERFTFEHAPSRARRIVRDGDIIVSTVRTYLRAISAITSADPNLVVSTGFAVIRPQELDSAFAAYAFRAPYFVEKVVAKSVGVSYPAINADELASIAIACPSHKEQRAIAGFLDRETAKIDDLVAKKERLVELLEEKRTALITQAVTKGLDPDVPMKDSRVEWLGEIPAHWETRRLKAIACKIGSGKTPRGGAQNYGAAGVMLLRSQNVQFDGLEFSDVAYIDSAIDDEMSGSRVAQNDVLLNITGASLGRCCIARLGGMRANVNQHVCIVRPNKRQVDAVFLNRSLQSLSLQSQIFNNENGVSRDAVNFEQVGSLVVTLPAIDEQRLIAKSIEREIAQMDGLMEKIRLVIDRLKELRAALISGAVTGKIDGRQAEA